MQEAVIGDENRIRLEQLVDRRRHQHRHRVDNAVSARTRIERQVDRPSRIQARKPAAVLAVERGEIPADQNLAVTLERERRHRPAVATRARVESRIGRAVQVQPRDPVFGQSVERHKRTADQNRPVGLHHNRRHPAVRTGAGTEVGIQRTIRVQARNPVEIGHAIDRGEIAPDQNLAIGLHRDGVHRAHRPTTAGGVKSTIDRAVGIQAHDALHRRAVEAEELATHENLPVALHRQRKDRAVGSGPDVEGLVQHAPGGQPREIRLIRPIHPRKIATNEHRPVHRRDRRGVHDRVRTRARIERDIQRAVRIEPRHAHRRAAVDGGEIARHQQLAVGVETRRVHRPIGPELRVERRIHQARRRRHRFVVEDRQHRIRERPQTRPRGPHRVGEEEIDRAVRVQHRVVDHRHREDQIRHPRPKIQRAVGRPVIQARHRAAVDRAKIHRHPHARQTRARHADGDLAAVFQHAERRPRELHRNVIVHNRQHRVAQSERRRPHRERSHIRQR